MVSRKKIKIKKMCYELWKGSYEKRSYRSIGIELGITHQTVKKYILEIEKKTKLKNKRIKETNINQYRKNRKIRLQKQKQYALNHKEQKKAYNKKYKEKNRDKLRKYQNEWNKNHPERVKEKAKMFRKNNLEKCKLYDRRRHIKHRKKRLERSMVYYQSHKEERKIYRKAYYQKHPEVSKRNGLNSRKRENKRRKKLGLPLIGEGYKSESVVYKIIKNIFPNLKIRRRDRSILEGLEIDIYLPQLKVGIEYMGIQHFERVKFFENIGGSRLEDIQKRDLKKRELCKIKGIKLIEFLYSEKITEQNIIKKLMDCKIKIPQKSILEVIT